MLGVTMRYTGTLVGSDGSRLVVRDAELVAAPAPVLAPVPASSGRQRALWDYGWKPLDLASLPPDILPSLTHIVAFVCQSARPGTGQLKPPPGWTRDRVATCRAAGLRVDLSIGGAQDGGITVVTAAQAAEMTASIRAQVQACGYTGVELDLEPSGGKWAKGAVLQVCRAAIADDLEVHITSALYDEWTDAWGQVVRALGPKLSSWRVMLYDFPEAADSRLTKVTTDKLRTMRGYLAHEDQLVAGYACGAAVVSSPVPVLRSAYIAGRSAHPAAGWALWHGDADRSNGWTAVRALSGV